MATMMDRYEIGCRICDKPVSHAQRSSVAFMCAESHAHRPNHSADDVTVFDRMARRGHVNKWSANGRAIGRRIESHA